MTKICLILTLLISVSQILIVGKFATLGENISALRLKSLTLREENQILEKTLLVSSSITSVEEKAIKLGFKRATIAFEKSPQALAKAYEAR